MSPDCFPLLTLTFPCRTSRATLALEHHKGRVDYGTETYSFSLRHLLCTLRLTWNFVCVCLPPLFFQNGWKRSVGISKKIRTMSQARVKNGIIIGKPMN